jgi:hypothetical protein
MRNPLPSLSLSFLVSLLLAGAAFGQGSSVPPAPQLSFETSAVLANGGLTPGRPVIWFGVEYGLDAEFSTHIQETHAVGTVAADGTARLDLDHPLAPRSIWVAVDQDSGHYTVAGANGFRLLKPDQPSQLVLGDDTKADALADQRQYLMGLAVRPGTGAWSFSGGDGGPRDQDGQNDGHLSFALDGFDPLDGSPAAPARAAAGDLWFVVDPYTMSISVSVDGVAQ